MAKQKDKSLSDEDIVRIMRSEFDESIGAPGGEISLDRARAYQYYLREPFGNEEEGQSKVVTSDVADVVDGYLPPLMRIFTTADNVVSFDAVGLEDEAQAQQESDYVGHVFFKRNNSFEITYGWMFDALLKRIGIVKAYASNQEEVYFETYENLTEDEYLKVLEDEELELAEKSEKNGEAIDPQTNAPYQTTLYDCQFRGVRTKTRYVVENVPPDEYRISQDARYLDPCSANFVGHEREVTRSDLLEMGFDEDIVNNLEPSELDGSTEREANRDKSDDRKKRKNPAPRDRSQDKFVLCEGYKEMDVDGDGKAELTQTFIVGDVLLEQAPIDRQPFHVLCPKPLPHKHIGLSVADTVMEDQVITSEVLRQTLNNLYHNNNPGHGVWEAGMSESTLDDLLTRELGSVTIFRRPVSESYAPMTVPFVAGESFKMLDYFDREKRDRTGISSDSEGLSPDALKHIQQSVMADSMDLSRMKIELVARIFAETGFKSLFRHLHELIRKHQTDIDVFKLRGQYVRVDPQSWKHRNDMTVHVGLGIGTRDQNMRHLEMIWQKQLQMVEGGGLGLTVTPKNIYNTAAEIVKNANFKTPELFYTDPGDKQAPPPSDEQQELERMQAEIQNRQQQLDAKDQAIKEAKLQLERQEDALRHQRELDELKRKKDADEDRYTIEIRKLRRDYDEMRLKYDTNVEPPNAPAG